MKGLMGSRRRGALRAAALAAVVCTVGATCSDAPTAPGAERTNAHIGLTATIAHFGAAEQRALATAGLTPDRMRVVLLRSKDTVTAVDVGASGAAEEVALDLTASVAASEQLTVSVSILSGTVLLFSGTAPLTAPSEGWNNSSHSLPLTYVGPGAGASKVVVSLSASVVGSDTPVLLTASTGAATDPQVSVPFIFSVSDSSIATLMTQPDRIRFTGRRGTVIVFARTLSGSSGQASATYAPPADQLAIVSGENQSGVVGTTLALPLVVRALAADGLPTAGQAISISGVGGASASPSEAISDSIGEIRTFLKLDTLAGPQSFVLRTGAIEVKARQSAAAGAATTLSILTGEGQHAALGLALPQPLVLRVGDRYGNAVAGAVVNWTASSGGTLSASQTVTDSAGTVSVRYTVATAGAHDIRAALSGGQAEVVLTATGVTRTATSLVVVSGAGQRGIAGSSLASPFIVELRDQNGAPLEGEPINFSGGGWNSPVTVVSDAAGRAQAVPRLSQVAGVQSFTASSGSLVATISATATYARTPVEFLEWGGNDQVVATSTVLPQPFVALVRDSAITAIPGVAIRWIASGDATPHDTTTVTDASGMTSISFTSGSVPGPYVVTANAIGTPLTLSFRFQSGPQLQRGRLSLTVPPPTTTMSGQMLQPAPVVQLEDSLGAPLHLAGVPVTVSVPPRNTLIRDYAGGAVGGTTTVLTDANGSAAFTNLTVTHAGRRLPLTFDATATGYAFDGIYANPIDFLPGVATSLDWNPSTPRSFSITAGVPPSPPPTLLVRDANGSPLGGVLVRVDIQWIFEGLQSTAALQLLTTDASGQVYLNGGWLPTNTSGGYGISASVSGVAGISGTLVVH